MYETTLFRFLQWIYATVGCVDVESAVIFEADDWHTIGAVINQIHEIDKDIFSS